MLAELEALEELHMFRTTKVNADVFEFAYASLFHVSIPCKKFIPIVSNMSITRFGKASTRYRDNFPKLSAFLLKTAQWYVSESDMTTVREVGIDI
jgi:kinetochore protein Spc7/SPC105